MRGRRIWLPGALFVLVIGALTEGCGDFEVQVREAAGSRHKTGRGGSGGPTALAYTFEQGASAAPLSVLELDSSPTLQAAEVVEVRWFDEQGRELLRANALEAAPLQVLVPTLIREDRLESRAGTLTAELIVDGQTISVGGELAVGELPTAPHMLGDVTHTWLRALRQVVLDRAAAYPLQADPLATPDQVVAELRAIADYLAKLILAVEAVQGGAAVGRLGVEVATGNEFGFDQTTLQYSDRLLTAVLTALPEPAAQRTLRSPVSELHLAGTIDALFDGTVAGLELSRRDTARGLKIVGAAAIGAYLLIEGASIAIGAFGATAAVIGLALSPSVVASGEFPPDIEAERQARRLEAMASDTRWINEQIRVLANSPEVTFDDILPGLDFTLAELEAALAKARVPDPEPIQVSPTGLVLKPGESATVTVSVLGAPLSTVEIGLRPGTGLTTPSRVQASAVNALEVQELEFTISVDVNASPGEVLVETLPSTSTDSAFVGFDPADVTVKILPDTEQFQFIRVGYSSNGALNLSDTFSVVGSSTVSGDSVEISNGIDTARITVVGGIRVGDAIPCVITVRGSRTLDRTFLPSPFSPGNRPADGAIVDIVEVGAQIRMFAVWDFYYYVPPGLTQTDGLSGGDLEIVVPNPGG